MCSYFKKLVYKLFLIISEKFYNSNLSTNSSSVYFENFFNYFRAVKVKFYYDKEKNFFLVVEGNKKIIFTSKLRGISLYRNGILKRSEFIFSSYCLSKIVFSKNDIVLDCGANYGDMYLKLSNLINPINYIGIEPSPSAFKALKLNVANESKLINKALGNINGNLSFFLSEDEGDSSLIEPKKFSQIITVPVIRLEELIKKLNIDKIKLLKVEAEGYEPEVLEGLGNKIGICEYIAVDGGYERGINSDQTFTVITNYLINNGFEIIDIYFPWCRALFMNKKNNS